MAETIEIHDLIEPIADEWEELAARTAAAPFVRPGWATAWWEAFGSGRMAVFTARRSGRLVGVLPARRRAGAVFSMTNLHTPLFMPVAEDDAARLALLRALFEGRPRRVELAFVPAEAEVAEGMRGADGSYTVVDRVLMRSPFVNVEGDWDSYWSSLSKNLRGTVRRCRNRLGDLGEVTIEVAERGENLGQLLAEGFAIEATGWKGKEKTAIASRPETRRFYEQVAGWAAEAGILRLAFLRIDGRAAAFSFNIEAGGSHYLLKLGHDAELSRAGPGTVLTAEMVKRCFTLGLASYEFLGHADRYKLRWTKECHDLVKAQAFARTPNGAVDRLIQTHGRAIAKKALRRT